MKNNIFFLCCLMCIFLMSCSHDKITYVDKIDYWSKYTPISYLYSFISNSEVVDNKLYCLTTGSILSISDITNNSFDIYNLYNNSNSMDYVPLIADNYFFTYDNIYHNIIVSSIVNGSLHRLELIPRQVDSTLIDFKFKMGTYLHKLGAFGDGRFYTWVEGYVNNRTVNYLIYFDLEYKNSNIIVTNKGKISLDKYDEDDHASNDLQFNYMFYYDHKLYLSYNRSSHSYYMIVNNDNTYIKEKLNILNGHNSFFMFKNEIWSQSLNFRLNSSNDGVNWVFRSYLSPYFHYFKEINDYVFFHNSCKIYAFKYTDNQIYYYEVPLENIKGLHINSLNLMNDNFIIATNNGLYFKNFNNLLNDLVHLNKEGEK